MDVKTLCLGILTFGDATGYDIKKYFEQALSHFFLAGYGSIYPALAELSAAGLVECREIPGEGRPDRKLYRLTDAGREAFVAALAQTEPRHKVRSEFLVLLYFSHMLPRERLSEVLDRLLAEIDRLLDLIEHTESEQGCPTEGIEFTCGLGRALLEAKHRYIRQNRHRIEGELPRVAGSRR
jgi:DNA-binding PadR family transcriptional regulator